MQARLPKTKRAPQAFANAQITERSLSIIDAIARYRFVLARDIVRVVGGNEDVTHRHLQQLFHRDLISRFALPMGPNRGEFVYFVDNAAGLRKLCESSRLNAEHFDWDEISRNRTKYGDTASRSAGQFLFIEHELMISTFHADLETSAREAASVEIERWVQGPGLWNSVEIGDGRVLAHRPDALTTLKFANAPEGQQRSTFFYEADRETSSLSRIRDKLVAHVSFLTRGIHTERYGFRKVRAVLIETLTQERASQMRQLCSQLATQYPMAPFLFWLSFANRENAGNLIHERRWFCGADARARAVSD